ncbi:MAG TPA: MFS transporter, partial [Ilumatobacteraceae bacterium]|nr:MFS transporter [Ilumatobacteraceae bacterium]
MEELLGEDGNVTDAAYRRRWWVLGVLCMSLLVIIMDNTILNVAIPSLIRDLDATNSDIQWIIDSYVIVFAGLLLTTGSLSDRFGRKGALQIGLVLFGIGSVSAALSHSTVHLIGSRAFMGIGGALIMPSTLSLLTNVFRDPKERARAIAIWAGFSGLGVAIGPLVRGTLLNHFSWQSVFWVNIPLCIIALTAGALLLPKSKDATGSALDPIGAVLSVVGLTAVLFGIIEGPSKGWTHSHVLLAFAIGVVGLAAFIIWELNTANPMLDMRLFRNPRFSAASSSITLTFFAMFGSMFLMTQYWQLVHGYSALEAGARMVPYALTMMVVAPMSARLVERVGTKRIVTSGLLVMATGLVLMSFIHADSSYLHVISIYMLMAAG